MDNRNHKDMTMTKNDIPDHETFTPIPDVPENVDPNRQPQYNAANIGCHCDCACSRGAADGGGGGAKHAIEEARNTNEADSSRCESETSSACGDGVVGDEGAEDHLIEVADLGFVSVQVIFRALARHERCTCHHEVLPRPDDYQLMPAASGVASPGDSLMVETSSDQPSMVSSQALSIPSHGSSVFEFACGFGPEALAQRFPVLYNPLRLTPDAGFEYQYPLELSISGSEFSVSRGDFSDYDMW